MKRLLFSAGLFAILLPLSVFGQTPDTVWVPNDGQLGTINKAIQGDTLSNGQRRDPNAVYALYRGGYYPLNGWLTIKPGTHITIVGQNPTPDSGKAVILFGAVPGLSYQFAFDCFGDLSMKNVWLLFENNLGVRPPWMPMIQFEQDTVTGKEHADFDSCIFDASEGICVQINCQHFTGTFNNCLIRNADNPSSFYSGGWVYATSTSESWDSLGADNCTFENIGQVCNINFAPAYRVWLNHNTFINAAGDPFNDAYTTWAVLTNNLFVNTRYNGFRWIDQHPGREDAQPRDAVINMDTLANNPVNNWGVTELQRVFIFDNNAYYLDPRIQDFFNLYNDTVTTHADSLFPCYAINSRSMLFFNGAFPHPYFSLKNFYQGVNPDFVSPPTVMDSIISFLTAQWDHTGQIVSRGYKYTDPSNPNVGTGSNWPIPDNCAYTNDTLLTAGTDGLPLGDLNWFPSKLAIFNANRAAYEQAIWKKTVTGVKERDNTVPQSYALGQNYPNPFNPTTQIDYSVAKNGYVTLEVYNVLGEEVATLFSGNQEPGNYVATFDGNKFASGVYFYRLQAGSTFLTKKMILMK